MEYLDFEIEVGPSAEREWPVTVLRSPAGEPRGRLRLPFDDLELENRLQALQIALLRSGGTFRRMLPAETQAAQDLGQSLFDALMAGDVRSSFDLSRYEAGRVGKGLRVKLRIQAPHLAALPWEFMYDSRQAEFLSLSRFTPIVRYIDLPRSIRPLAVEPPLRMLGLVVSPDDLAPLNVERERQRIEVALAPLRDQVEVSWLEGGTWRDLQRAMNGGPWHIFHFVGHGRFDPEADEGFVALADEHGGSSRLTATQLGRVLADHPSLRLVQLNACEGAKGGTRDLFSGTAAILVRRGIPAVVAMQYEISDRAAVEFARAFYEQVASGLPVDAASAEARKSVSLADSASLEWGTPVLYMRSPDGVLFDIPAEQAARPRRAEEPEPSAVLDAVEAQEPAPVPMHAVGSEPSMPAPRTPTPEPVALTPVVEEPRAAAVTAERDVAAPSAPPERPFQARELLPSSRTASIVLCLLGIALVLIGGLVKNDNNFALLVSFPNGFDVQMWIAAAPVVLSAVAAVCAILVTRRPGPHPVASGVLIGLGGAIGVSSLQLLFALATEAIDPYSETQAFLSLAGAVSIVVAGFLASGWPPVRERAPSDALLARRALGLSVVGAALVLAGQPILFLIHLGKVDTVFLWSLPELMGVTAAVALVAVTGMRSLAHLSVRAGVLAGLGLDAVLAGMYFFGPSFAEDYIFDDYNFGTWETGGLLVFLGGLIVIVSAVLVALVQARSSADSIADA